MKYKVLVILLICFAMFASSAVAEDLVIPDNVRVIETSAFENDLLLDRVILPDGLQRIESRAFAGSGVKQIHLPSLLEYISDDAFLGCEGVLTMTAEEGTYGYSWALEHGFLNNRSNITIWVTEKIVELTTCQLDEFIAEYPQYAAFDFTVAPVGEGDAVDAVLFDLEAAADVYCFAQDQLARLVYAQALSPVDESTISNNDSGAIAAASLYDTVYAYPMTSDNGYFLFYDSSIVSDPSTLEAILADCESNDALFCMELDSGWYQTAFFFGAGCTMRYDVDSSGGFASAVCDYASANGLNALKSMIRTVQSPIFMNTSYDDALPNIGAIVTGTWDSSALYMRFGSHYAAAKLPVVSSFQMSSFGGYKLLGIKPQTDPEKQAACHAVAAFLTAEKAQLDRYQAAGWGPSNLLAQADPTVRNDITLAALAAQSAYAVPQGQYPVAYWNITQDFGNKILIGAFDGLSDSELLNELQTYQSSLLSIVP